MKRALVLALLMALLLHGADAAAPKGEHTVTVTTAPISVTAPGGMVTTPPISVTAPAPDATRR